MQKEALARYTKLLNGKHERLVSASDDHTLYLWEYPNKGRLPNAYIYPELAPITRMPGH